jgi:hypothetical protein
MLGKDCDLKVNSSAMDIIEAQTTSPPGYYLAEVVLIDGRSLTFKLIIY